MAKQRTGLLIIIMIIISSCIILSIGAALGVFWLTNEQGQVQEESGMKMEIKPVVVPSMEVVGGGTFATEGRQVGQIENVKGVEIAKSAIKSVTNGVIPESVTGELETALGMITNTAQELTNCPYGWKEYGVDKGGFCCDKNVTNNGQNCDGSICAWDTNKNPQGNQTCSAVREKCPSGTNPYGFYAGGFCCEGLPELDQVGNYPITCKNKKVCAVDSNTKPQGLTKCSVMYG